MKKLTIATWTAILSGISASGIADSESGVYVGGSVGKAHLNYNNLWRYDSQDNAYKLVAGYKFDLSSDWYLAVETSYRDWGSFESNIRSINSISSNSTHDLTSVDLFVIAGYEWGDLGVFGKAGRSLIDSDVRGWNSVAGEFSSSNSEEFHAFGVGVNYDFGGVSVRAEYEIFNESLNGITDVPSMLSIGATYSF